MQKYIILFFISVFSVCQAKNDLINKDYTIFGMKEPASLGSFFSTLGNDPIFFNPVSVAFITDNRIIIGYTQSDVGDGYLISWTSPNFSISNARHIANLQESNYSEYRKDLLKFCFAFSNIDFGLNFGNILLSSGIAVKHISDRLFDGAGAEFGGNALSIDLGFHLSWDVLDFELAILNINSPRIGGTDLNYARGVSLCLRYQSPSEFMIGMQGITSDSYAGSDIGINLAAQQSFLDHRLTSRIQLTSFFKETEAIMQNISAGIGYRPQFPEKYSAFQDIEFSYALSFLSLPQTVGTHLLVLTKYF